MPAKEIIEAIAAGVVGVASNDKLQGLVLGKYSDGTPRSIPDAIKGEYKSPSTKAEKKKKSKKHKKKVDIF